ncbi:hypothetical protein ABZP36_009914 [Zizania latifolia]
MGINTIEMLTRFYERFNRFVCGFSSPPVTTPEEDAVAGEVEDAMLSTPFLVCPWMTRGRSVALHPDVALSLQGVLSDDEKRPMRRAVAEEEGVALLPPPPPPPELRKGGKDEKVRLPFLAFSLRDGYRVFSLAENHLCDGDGDGEVRMWLVSSHRHVASLYGGKVFVTSLFDRFLSHLVDPFTEERTPLPDLPIPFSKKEPMPCAADEPHTNSTMPTDDGFAWDWSPRGVMVAHGDTMFFCETGDEEWKLVHWSPCNSPMTVNYRSGFFFIFE